jgi:hypothetical protein
VSFTVTAAVVSSPTGDAVDGVSLDLKVVTGAVCRSPVGVGGKAATTKTASPYTTSITPTWTGSLIVFAAVDDSNDDAFSAAASNTLYNDYHDTSGGIETCDGWYSGTVTAGTPVTVGATTSSGTQDGVLAVAEIQPLVSGTTPAVLTAGTATAPAFVDASSGSSISTGSFQPPGGSVLLAMVCVDLTSTNTDIPTCSMTDSSGRGLVWTLLEGENPDTYACGAFIFAAAYPPTNFMPFFGGF